MEFRHEWKHVINNTDYIILQKRLRAALCPDPNGDREGRYVIRSLYFDTPGDKALREKLDGVNRREKFRLRCYGTSDSLIRLEKKSKCNGLCSKETAELTREQTEAILRGDTGWMPAAGGLIAELYAKMQSQLLRPRTLVQYNREAYVYPAGNVRVTIDRDLRTGLYATDLLSREAVMIPAGAPMILLEVKYDAFLPDMVAQLVQLGNRRASAFSKYAACRMYG